MKEGRKYRKETAAYTLYRVLLKQLCTHYDIQSAIAQWSSHPHKDDLILQLKEISLSVNIS